jgi:uncharacterized membrane protein YheB (UPF0754 family)
MPDYNLFGLDARTFQQLVQALAAQEVAAGIVVHGDGRDGARDASYQGRMKYPCTTAPWDGTLIIQAKYRKVPMGDGQKEWGWLRRQMQDEFEKLRKNKTDVKYYILATNIELTSVPDNGTEDKAREFMAAHAKRVGIKEFEIWDGKKIARLLDSHRDVAIAYGGFVTTGDVLSKLFAQLGFVQKNFDDIISQFLQSELHSEQYARLNEAGSAAERKQLLARVFVDLPTSVSPQREEQTQDFNFVRMLVSLGAQRFDRATVMDRIKTYPGIDGVERGRIVLIGGPGQGKSTVGQFVCQLYRVALLRDRPPIKLTDSASDAIRNILEACKHDGIDVPTVRRLPIRVDLKTFADELAKQLTTTLLDHIARKIDRRSSEPVNRVDLQRLLTSYPWLLILDGLDEVPSTGNREEVLSQIEAFEAQCATKGGDVLIVATSRPQGYAGAFASHIYAHLYLLPLTPEQAMHYATRLVGTCHPSDPELREDILARLKRATRSPTTARLMQTPLQVTILSVLAEISGELPDDRWALFDQYYDTIIRRETQRGLALSAVLRDHRKIIDRIHRHVGLRLQRQSELAGANNALLAKNEFEGIVEYNLSGSALGDKRDRLRRQITEAALERLVFLVSPQGDEIGFEIRSLQEFMAAEALMDGDDGQVRARLNVIAPIPFWRNVVLFMVGKCAAKRDYLIPSVINVCQTANDVSDPIASAVFAGSQLAADILEDDILRAEPLQGRAIAEIALKLLERPSVRYHRRLAAVFRASRGLEPTYEAAIRRVLELAQAPSRLAGWALLLQLADANHRWALTMLSQRWPRNVDEQANIVMQCQQPKSKWTRARWAELAPHMAPFHVRFAFRELEKPRLRLPSWVHRCIADTHMGGVGIPLVVGGVRYEGMVHFRPVPVGQNDDDLAFANDVDLSRIHPDWIPLIASTRLHGRPTASNLAEQLRLLSDQCENATRVRFYAIWPMVMCLMVARVENMSLRDMAAEVQKGTFGDYEAWRRAEDTWAISGAVLEKLLEVPSGPYFALQHGWCFGYIGYNPDANLTPDVLERMVLIREGCASRLARVRITSWFVRVLQLLNNSRASIKVNVHLLRTMMAESTGDDIPWVNKELVRNVILSVPERVDEDWLDSIDWFGRNVHLVNGGDAQSGGAATIPMLQASLAEKFRPGLLRFLAEFHEDVTKVSKELLVLEGEGDARVWRDKLFLLLLNGSIRRPLELAEAVAQSPHLAAHNLRTVLAVVPDESWGAEFVVGLLNNLSPTQADAASACIEWLEACLSRRKSQFHDRLSVAKLGLSVYLDDVQAAQRPTHRRAR